MNDKIELKQNKTNNELQTRTKEEKQVAQVLE